MATKPLCKFNHGVKCSIRFLQDADCLDCIWCNEANKKKIRRGEISTHEWGINKEPELICPYNDGVKCKEALIEESRRSRCIKCGWCDTDGKKAIMEKMTKRMTAEISDDIRAGFQNVMGAET